MHQAITRVLVAASVLLMVVGAQPRRRHDAIAKPRRLREAPPVQFGPDHKTAPAAFHLIDMLRALPRRHTSWS